MDRIPSAPNLKPAVVQATSLCPRFLLEACRISGVLVLAIVAWVCATGPCYGQSSSEPASVLEDDLALEPYIVFVAAEEAYARCGPADDYYRTDPLRTGQELEVYAETADGWLGVRPPDESFCWIPAEAAELDADDETGTIVEDRTVAWIGTQLGRARHYRWQVQLAEGEPITVVGRSEREGPDGPQLWLRIVPPSGEYRWVHRDDVVESSEALVALLKEKSQSGNQDSAVASNTAGSTFEPREDSNKQPLATNASSRRQTADDAVRSSRSDRSLAANDDTIGSGLKQPDPSDRGAASRGESPEERSTAQRLADAVKQSGLLASIEFLGQPRVVEIDAQPAAPETIPPAEDGNWVAGAARRDASRQASSVADHTSSSGVKLAAPTPTRDAAAGDWQSTPRSGVMQATSLQPANPSRSFVTPAAGSENVRRPKSTIVSAERIQQIETEIQDADYEQLSLVFSRLMAAGATGAETEPVERAARRMASSSDDAVIAGRARLLAERAQQYRRVANRRDGEAVIRSTSNLSIPPLPETAAPQNASQANAAPSIEIPATAASTVKPVDSNAPAPRADDASRQTGYLVQVYSARKNSPPFALTDNAGRTLAYVTPAPGVNLRSHLNSMISVSGNPGYLTGLNTPHILVTEVARTPEF